MLKIAADAPRQATRAEWDNIPPAMRAQKRWFVWNYEPDEKGNPTKKPKQLNGRNAASNNPQHWLTFDAACKAVESGKFDGIGFSFRSLVSIHLESCRDPKTGAITPEAQEIVDKFPTYSEVSRDGTGIRIQGQGAWWDGTWSGSVQTKVNGLVIKVFQDFASDTISNEPRDLTPFFQTTYEPLNEEHRKLHPKREDLKGLPWLRDKYFSSSKVYGHGGSTPKPTEIEFFAVDMDGCGHSDGTFTPWAQEIVDKFPTYAERSPSGKGIRIVGYGSWTNRKTSPYKLASVVEGKTAELRVFYRAGYVTLTGRKLDEAHAELRNMDPSLAWLESKHYPASDKHGPVTEPTESEMARIDTVPEDTRLRRCKAYLKTLPPSIEGSYGRGPLWNAAKVAVRGFALPTDKAIEALDQYNQEKCFPPWPYDGPQGLERVIEQARTNSDMSWGAKLKDDFGGVDYPEGDQAWMADPNKQTDHELARRFTKRFESQLRYVPQWGKWLIWDGRRWCIDHKQVRAMGLVREFCDELWNGYGPLAKGMTQKQVGALHQFLKGASKRNTIESVLVLAKSERDLLVDKDELNAAPGLLNVLNGTIDLWDGKLHGHKPEQLITQLAPVHYDPKAKAPQWERFLNLVFELDFDLIRYVRQLIGYSATGVADEAVLPICIGSGANGKSTLWSTILGVLGDYGFLAPEALVVGRGEQHPTQIAALYGRRFVPISEPEQSAQLREARVKELTGDSTITARRMHEDLWSFTRTHTFWMSTNYLPKVTGSDDGIWRRIKVIPFNVDLRKATKPIAGFDKKLIEEEASGILNWILEGAKDYFANGFMEPACVKLATGRYRGGEDELGNFVNECCEVGPGFEVTAADVFDAYVRWGGKLTKTAFGKDFCTRYERDQPTSGPFRKVWIYRGIRVSQGGGA